MNSFSPFKRFVGSFLPNCLLRYTELSPLDKIVWARLAQYAGDSEYCYPKQNTLAEELGVSLKSIKRSLLRLEDEGFFRIERPDSAAKMKRLGNKYYFLEHEILRDSSGVKLSLDEKAESTRRSRRRTKIPSGVKLTPQEENHYKENQETKKLKKNFAELFPKSFQQHGSFIHHWEEFLQFRKEDIKKAVSEIAAKRLASKLTQDSANNVDTAIEMINQSIERGYRGIFPVNQNNTSSRQQVKYGHKGKDYGYGKADIELNNEDWS